MRKKTAYWIKGIIMLAVLTAVDQLTKLWAATTLTNGDVVIWDGVFRLSLVKNTGAVFGMFKGATAVLAVISVIILAVMLWFFHRLPEGRRYTALRWITVFITAGALGNLIDRLVYGYVVDFLYFELINFYVFNIADCYITVSIIIVLLLMVFKYREDDFKFLNPKKSAEKVTGSEGGDGEGR